MNVGDRDFFNIQLSRNFQTLIGRFKKTDLIGSLQFSHNNKSGIQLVDLNYTNYTLPEEISMLKALQYDIRTKKTCNKRYLLLVKKENSRYIKVYRE